MPLQRSATLNVLGASLFARTLARLRPEPEESLEDSVGIKDDEGRQEDDDSEESDESNDEEGEDEAAAKAAAEAAAEQKGAHTPEPDIFIEKLPFCSIVAGLCIVNLQALALQVDFDCHRPNCMSDRSPLWENVLDIFTIVFLLELAVRMYVAGVSRFFFGEATKDKYKIDALNCLDVLIVLFRVVDLWMVNAAAGEPSGLFMVSAFRIYRIGPCAKLLQLTTGIRELWLVLSAFSDTLKTLGWVILMMIMLTYIAAIVLAMSMIGDANADFNTNRAEWQWSDYFGSVSSTMMSLFQLATRDKWGDSLVEPLLDRHLSLLFFFIVFFCCAGMALMNSIAAIVVESTLSTSKTAAEKDAKEREKQDDMVMESLRNIFHDADTDGSGELDRDELETALRTHRVRDRLKMLRIPLREMTMLFSLLDTDETGFINCDMFFRGVARLRGQARAFDVHQLSIDLNRCTTWCEDTNTAMNTINDQLANLLDNIFETDVKIVQGSGDEMDPVLVNRRARGSDQNKYADRIRMHVAENQVDAGSKDIWIEDGQSESGSQNAMSNLAKRGNAKMKKSNEDDGKRGGSKNKEKPLQPPPPPLPEHLKALKDKKDIHKVKKVKKVHAKAGPGRKEYSF